MKPGKTFKLAKRTKTIMATITDPVMRNQFKNMMIDAQLASEVVIKREPRNDKNAPRGGAAYVTNETGTASTSQE